MTPLKSQGFPIPDVPITDPTETGADWQEEVARLAAMPPIEAERHYDTVKLRLGCTVKTLDAEVRAARKAAPKDSALIVEDLEPWPEPVDGATLLDEIAAAARKYAVLPAGGAEVIALWILLTHAVDAFYHSPRLAVMAPEKRCGKSVVLDFLEVLAPRAIKTENLSTPVLFRLCDELQPTVLADEVDGFLKSNPELISMLNAGHKRGGKALRCEGDDNKIRAFNVFGPCALAGIGSLPATLADRSLAINMRRATKDESPVPFRSDRAQREKALARKAARWAADNIQALKTAEPSVPGYMFNRVADNWRPIFAIAEMCGSDWLQKATNAAATITADTTAEPSVGEMLLAAGGY